MGYWKNRQIEIDERGWSELPGVVCASCVKDRYLSGWLHETGQPGTCTYCGRSGQVVTGDDLMALIAEAVYSEWTDPDAAGVPYDGREGGYQADTSTATEDILKSLGWPFESDDLAQAVIDGFTDHAWVSQHLWIGSPEELLTWGWQRFVRVVLHERRYLFLRAENTADDVRYKSGQIEPYEMLDRLGEVIDAAGTFKLVPAGFRFVRARIHEAGASIDSGQDLGTAPSKAALHSNRMSPAGIPMFYGALDRETAEAEVLAAYGDTNARVLTSGEFVAARDLRLVDLSVDFDLPNIFDSERRYLRGPIGFLNGFARSIAQPVSSDALEHIDYVPTQVVTEYVRHYLGSTDLRIDGILYRSAQRDGGVCVVLFAEQQHCGTLGVPSGDVEPILALDLSSLQSAPKPPTHGSDTGE